MKNLIIIFFAFIFNYSCTNLSKSISDRHLIVSGKGYDNLIVGESTIYDVMSKYGTDYIFKNGIADIKGGPSIHLYRYNYQSLGIDFQSDVEEPQSENPKDYILKSISFRHPFNGVTKENIKLNETKRNELIKILGNNYRLFKTYQGFERLIYNELGVSFNINKETDIIEEITVFRPYK